MPELKKDINDVKVIIGKVFTGDDKSISHNCLKLSSFDDCIMGVCISLTPLGHRPAMAIVYSADKINSLLQSDYDMSELEAANWMSHIVQTYHYSKLPNFVLQINITGFVPIGEVVPEVTND